MTFCHDKDSLKRKASDFWGLAKEALDRSQRYEVMAYDTEYSLLDHVRECDLCQGKAPTQTESDPLLGVV